MFSSRRNMLRGKRRPLLSDHFGKPLAAGALNATPATPGPGTRTVKDTESKLSITDAGLVCAGGKATAAFGDPGIWYPAVTRALGKTMIVGPVSITDVTSILFIGFDSDTVSNPDSNSYVIASDSLKPRDSATSGAVIYTPLDNTPYYLAIRLLAAGAEYYIRTATGPWKLLWRGGTNATATLYPGIGNYSAAFILSKPGVQIPATPWNPPCLAYDSFTRSDGAVGSSEALDDSGISAPVRAYSAAVGTWAISSNTLVCSALDGGIGIIVADVLTLDTLTTISATVSAGTGGVIVRYVDADNYVRLIHDGTNVKLIKRVAGSETTVANVATAYSAGTQIRCICEGTTFTIFYNNALVGTSYTISDAALQTGTKIGVYTSDTGNSFDGLRSAARGTNGEYNSLDKYLR